MDTQKYIQLWARIKWLTVILLASTSVAFSQDVSEVVITKPTAVISLRSVSPNQLTAEGLEETGLATGLPVVGVGTTAYLQGSGLTAEGSTITSYAWTITGPRANMEYSTQNVTFSPPTEGIYKATLVVTNSEGQQSDPVTTEITSAKYMGIRNCASCHGGQRADLDDMVSGWKETGHATALTRKLDSGPVYFSENCVSCHSVGYDLLAENKGFDDVAESIGWTFPETITPGNWENIVDNYPSLANVSNIQCESCHGPGSLHLGDPTRIATSIDAGVCSTCHDSGSHHTKKYEWDTSNHADPTGYPTGPGRESCVGCHTGIGFVQRMDPDYEGVAINTDLKPISCAACHDPHNHDNKHQLRVLADVELGNGVVVSAKKMGYGALCINCHKSRRNVNEYVQEYHSHYGPHHGPQGDVLAGTGGYEFPGLEYTDRSPHYDAVENTCVGCHMAPTPADAPSDSVGVHTFNVVKTVVDENGVEKEIQNVNACIKCHDGLSGFNRTAAGDYDGDGTVEGLQDEVKGLLALVGVLLPPLDSEEVEVTEDYTPVQLQAAYNYELVVEDKSYGIHNSVYLVQLLQSSYHALSGQDVPGADLTIQWTPEVTPVVPEPTPTITPVPENAPIAVPGVRAVSPRDMERESLTDGVASGLQVVGVGTTVYLQGKATYPPAEEGAPAPSEISAYQWTVKGPGMSATYNVQNATFRPPTEGVYTAELIVTNAEGVQSAPQTMEITSAEWVGIRNCASCHDGSFSGLDDTFTTWQQTHHATALERKLETISSFKEYCVSCHSVGYDVVANNNGFDDVQAAAGWVFPATIEDGNWDLIESDYPDLANVSSIQCESCHGPGSLHYGNEDRIEVSMSTRVCASCHDSGTHHTKNYEWDTSNHANPTGYPTGPGRESCVGCHTGIGYVQRMDSAYADKEINTDLVPIGCASCHDPHDAKNPHQIRTEDQVVLGNDVVVSEENMGAGLLCINCHKSRRNVDEYVLEYHSHYGPHHGPQGDVINGTGGYEYPGVEYTTFSPHLGPINADTCVSCHMADPPEGAPENSVGLHTYRVSTVITNEQGEEVELENLNACITCHSDLTTFNRTAHGDYDGDGTVEGIKDEVSGLLTLVGNLLPPLGSPEVEVTEEYTQDQLKAAYNHAVVVEDKSWGIHNPKYCVQLLQSSYRALSGQDVPGAEMQITWPGVEPTSTPIPVQPTPTPTVTPTPISIPTPPAQTGVVIVTDNLQSSEDLSGSADKDANQNRSLVVRWDLTQSNADPTDVADIHVYISVDGSDYSFLGRRGIDDVNYFEWKTNGRRTALPFRNGPEFGHSYQFRIYVITASGSPKVQGPFQNESPVTMRSLVSVSQSADAITLQWEYDNEVMNADNLRDVHIYVQVEGLFKFLGRTGEGTVQSFEWKSGALNVSPAFQNGPVSGQDYAFRIYFITASGTPRFYGPLLSP